MKLNTLIKNMKRCVSFKWLYTCIVSLVLCSEDVREEVVFLVEFLLLLLHVRRVCLDRLQWLLLAAQVRPSDTTRLVS